MENEEYLEEIGFVVKPGEEIEVWLEGGRSLKGKLKRYDSRYKNMVLVSGDKEVLIPRRFVVAIIKQKA